MGESQLAAALVKAQGKMQNPKFDSSNTHFRSKYASLASVRAAVIPTFLEQGIAVLQRLVTTEQGTGCHTELVHESGERLDCGVLFMPVAKPDAHGHGSAITYARRYALQAIAGVVGDDDDDGNAAVDKPAGPAKVPAKSKSRTKREAVQTEAPEVDTVALGLGISTAKAAADLEPLKAEILKLRATSQADYEKFRDAWKAKQSELAGGK